MHAKLWKVFKVVTIIWKARRVKKQASKQHVSFWEQQHIYHNAWMQFVRTIYKGEDRTYAGCTVKRHQRFLQSEPTNPSSCLRYVPASTTYLAIHLTWMGLPLKIGAYIRTNIPTSVRTSLASCLRKHLARGAAAVDALATIAGLFQWTNCSFLQSWHDT